MVPSPQLTQKCASRGGAEHTCPAGHGPLGTLLPSRGTQGCCVPQGRAAGLPHRLQASLLSCHTPASPRRGDPIREVISRHDSSFPCSVPWRHFDLDRNSCRRLARRIPAGDRCHWGAEGSPFPPHTAPRPRCPHPTGLPLLPPMCGHPTGAGSRHPDHIPSTSTEVSHGRGLQGRPHTVPSPPMLVATSPLCLPAADPGSRRYFRGLHGSPRYLASGRRR